MPFLIVPTSELEAVNECLANISKGPVSTISGTLGKDVQMALTFVRSVNRELQSRGWFWNTDKDYKITPDGNNDLLLPSNTLAVDTTGDSADLDLVQRGSRLYDRVNHTYSFTEPVYVNLVTGLTFEELPEPARRYIALRAARLFADRIDGEPSSGDTQDELVAMAQLVAEHLRVEDANVLTGSWGMFRTLNRRRY